MVDYSEFEARILKEFPKYIQTVLLDDLRNRDYQRLDDQEHVYLDYTGGNLYAKSQLDAHHVLLKNGIFGNPHSLNPSSMKASVLVDETRRALLNYFNAVEDYFLVFTPNASGALKIIGESYPFTKNSHFLLPFDNHNSVNGIREYARQRGASYSYSPLNYDDLRFNEIELAKNLGHYDDKSNKLFAYPAQSNVSGVKHSLEWVDVAHSKNWDVLLDASAFVPTNKLDLKKVTPDFVSMSFYKMFGYPTGLGALLIRKSKFKKLTKPWFAGGTVTLASAMTDKFYLAEDHAKFEDGTLNYLDIPALKIGIDHLKQIGMGVITARVEMLTAILLQELQGIKHENGSPVIKIFGPKQNSERGGTIIFNFLTPSGDIHPFVEIEKLANDHNISLRTGCFCNPGIDEINSNLKAGELEKYFKSSKNVDVEDMINHLDKMRGAVRISVGLVTNLKDIYRLLEFVREFAS